MREPRRLELGRVNVEGEDLWFEPSKSTSFDVRPGELVALMVLFRYQEASGDEETARFALSAELDGQRLGPSTHVIRDRKLLVDDAMGFVDLAIPVPARGVVRGSFVVSARYDKKEWGSDDEGEMAQFAHDGEFELRVS